MQKYHRNSVETVSNQPKEENVEACSYYMDSIQEGGDENDLNNKSQSKRLRPRANTNQDEDL